MHYHCYYPPTSAEGRRHSREKKEKEKETPRASRVSWVEKGEESTRLRSPKEKRGSRTWVAGEEERVSPRSKGFEEKGRQSPRSPTSRQVLKA